MLLDVEWSFANETDSLSRIQGRLLSHVAHGIIFLAKSEAGIVRPGLYYLLLHPAVRTSQLDHLTALHDATHDCGRTLT